jgi:two-component system phosphate regulon response regulator PhoB
VLLDINLPNGNGLDLLKYVREDLHSDMPVIVLSALKQETNVIRGLNFGANDYVTKPFSLRELMLRMEKLLQVT